MKLPSFPTTGTTATALAALLPFVVVAMLAGASAVVWKSIPARSDPGSLTAGIAALDANDYATARRVFQTLADKNDPAAELWLAHLYQDGLGVAPNAAQAVTLLTKAADAGSARAAGQLGTLYLHGDGVLQDAGAAQRWLSLAAQHGDAVAQRELGLLYAQGLGTAKDPQKAYVWLNIAARDGDAQAALQRDRVLASLAPTEAAQATAAATDQQRLLTAEAQSGGHDPATQDIARAAPPAAPAIRRS
jgi:TPR repeat protein